MPKKKIVLAPANKVGELRDEVRKVINAMGIESFLVTDESTIWDFDMDEEETQNLSKALGIPVSKNDYVWEVAQRLKGELPANKFD